MAKYVINTGLPQEMTEEEILALKPVLEAIRDGFEPDPIFEPVCTTQYIAVTYRDQNPTKPVLDGYTIEMILGYQVPTSEGV